MVGIIKGDVRPLGLDRMESIHRLMPNRLTPC
jgi:hypothetical protein